MGTRCSDDIDLTLCVPQICTFVANVDEYASNIDTVRKTIFEIFSKHSERSGLLNFSVHINTRDNYETCELYLTAIGSSIESGDE